MIEEMRVGNVHPKTTFPRLTTRLPSSTQVPRRPWLRVPRHARLLRMRWDATAVDPGASHLPDHRLQGWCCAQCLELVTQVVGLPHLWLSAPFPALSDYPWARFRREGGDATHGHSPWAHERRHDGKEHAASRARGAVEEPTTGPLVPQGLSHSPPLGGALARLRLVGKSSLVPDSASTPSPAAMPSHPLTSPPTPGRPWPLALFRRRGAADIMLVCLRRLTPADEPVRSQPRGRVVHP